MMPCPAIQAAAIGGNASNEGRAPAAMASARKPAPPTGTVIAMACITVPVRTPRRKVALLRANVNAPRAA